MLVVMGATGVGWLVVTPDFSRVGGGLRMYLVSSSQPRSQGYLTLDSYRSRKRASEKALRGRGELVREGGQAIRPLMNGMWKHRGG